MFARFSHGAFLNLMSVELIKILRDQIVQLTEAQGLGEYTLQRFTQWQNTEWGKNHHKIKIKPVHRALFVSSITW